MVGRKNTRAHNHVLAYRHCEIVRLVQDILGRVELSLHHYQVVLNYRGPSQSNYDGSFADSPGAWYFVSPQVLQKYPRYVVCQ